MGRFGSQDAFTGAEAMPVSLHRYLYGNNEPLRASGIRLGQFTMVEANAAMAIIDAFHWFHHDAGSDAFTAYEEEFDERDLTSIEEESNTSDDAELDGGPGFSVDFRHALGGGGGRRGCQHGGACSCQGRDATAATPVCCWELTKKPRAS